MGLLRLIGVDAATFLTWRRDTPVRPLRITEQTLAVMENHWKEHFLSERLGGSWKTSSREEEHNLQSDNAAAAVAIRLKSRC